MEKLLILNRKSYLAILTDSTSGQAGSKNQDFFFALFLFGLHLRDFCPNLFLPFGQCSLHHSAVPDPTWTTQPTVATVLLLPLNLKS